MRQMIQTHEQSEIRYFLIIDKSKLNEHLIFNISPVAPLLHFLKDENRLILHYYFAVRFYKKKCFKMFLN